MRLVFAFLVSIPFLSACANVPDRRVNAYHFVNEKSCALIVGGGTEQFFADPRINDVWFQASKTITDDLYRDMTTRGYPVREYIVPLDVRSRPREQFLENIALEMSVNRCNRIIQIAQIVSEDADGRFFGYRVDVMLAKPENLGAQSAVAATRVALVGEYTKQYRYPRNVETFKTLQFHKLAEKFFSDMADSGELKNLR